eukprot:2549056-Rhodomonas_salina.1
MRGQHLACIIVPPRNLVRVLAVSDQPRCTRVPGYPGIIGIGYTGRNSYCGSKISDGQSRTGYFEILQISQ